MPGIRIASDQDFSTISVGRFDGLTEYRTGLIGEYAFGRNKATSIPNGANPDLPLVPYGTPTFADRSFTSSVQSWFDTQITPGDDFTAAVVCQKGSGFQQVIGSYNGNASLASFSLFINADAFAQFSAVGSDQNTDFMGLTGDADAFRMVTVRCSGVVNPVIETDEFRAGARTANYTETFTGFTRRPLAQSFAIGSHRGNEAFDGAGAQSNSFASAFIWNTVLSDADLLDMYLGEQARLAALSSPIAI